MITSKEIQYAMLEMDYREFTRKLNQFIDVQKLNINVRDIVTEGVKGWLKPYVAWVLNLKRHIPDGWKPTQRVIKPPKNRTIPKDTFVKGEVLKGEKHFNYRNGRSYDDRDRMTNRAKSSAENKQKITNIIEKLGGTAAASRAARCSVRTVDGWRVLRKKGLYIPRKYIGNIMDYCVTHDINITKQELIDMLPEGEK